MKQELRDFLIKFHKTLFPSHYRKMLRILEPSVFGLEKEGFGKEGDGTYVLPIELIENSNQFTLLSFGISNDISFEIDFKKKFPLIDIYAFDPTIDYLPNHNVDINFQKIGLAGKADKTKSIFTLKEIFRKLDLDYKKKYILKIDIEGWEWGVLSDLDLKCFNIPIITIELHFFPLIGKKETLLLPYLFYKKYKILKKILGSFYLNHLHANNYQYLNFKSFRFPTYIEWSAK
jgi:hypothetical protein